MKSVPGGLRPSALCTVRDGTVSLNRIGAASLLSHMGCNKKDYSGWRLENHLVVKTLASRPFIAK